MDPRELWERGRARWPALELSFDRFGAGAEEASGEVHAEDLFLARACLAGVPGAASTFEREHRDALQAFVARVERRPDAVRELAQELLVEILVGPPPKLASYSGRGPLRAW